jgi:hypothetical protein
MKGPESFPRNNPEHKAEKIRSKEEILSLITERIPGLPSIEESKGNITRVLEDTKGIYLLELEVSGSMPGQVHQYRYMRKGDHDNRNFTQESRIDVVLYEDGIPITSDQLATFDGATQSWHKV